MPRYRRGVTVFCRHCGKNSTSTLCSYCARMLEQARAALPPLPPDEVLRERLQAAVRRLAYLQDSRDENFDFYRTHWQQHYTFRGLLA